MRPIHIAAQFGQMEIVKFLIKHGAELNKKDQFGRNSVYWAFDNAKVEVAKFLMSKGVLNDPPKRERDFNSLKIDKDDSRLRFINHFKTVMGHVNQKNMKLIFQSIADEGSQSVKLLNGKLSSELTEPKAFDKNFLFHDIIQ